MYNTGDALAFSFINGLHVRWLYRETITLLFDSK